MRRFLSALAALALFAGAAPLPTCAVSGAAGHTGDGPAAGGQHAHGHEPGGHEHHGVATAADPSRNATGHGHGACTEMMRCHWAALPAAAAGTSDEPDSRALTTRSKHSPALPPDPFAATPPPRIFS